MMKKISTFTILSILSAACTADSSAVFGLMEQIPVIGENQQVKARPVYILTDRPLSAPAVFSGLQLTGDIIEVVCCYEVHTPTPLSLKGEIAKYAEDPEFARQLQGIKGYNHLYQAQLVDKKSWSPAMKALMADPPVTTDSYRFSLAVIAATFNKPTMPATFELNGKKTAYGVIYPRNAERVVHSFVQGKRRVEISEETMTVEGH